MRPVSARVRILATILAAVLAAAAIVGAVTFIVAGSTIASGSDAGEALAAAVRAFTVATTIVVIAVGVVSWFAIEGLVLSPIRDIRNTADAITLDDLGARVPEAGNDHVAVATRTVNSMLDRLESSVGAQRQLLDDVRHELKTPITIVRGYLETMDTENPLDVDATREIGIAELDRMTRLVEDIDLLATVEGGDALQTTVVELASLTSHVGDLVTAIPEHGWSVTSRARGTVQADHDRLVQAWLQLADNAAKYTPPGSPIEIGSSVGIDAALLWVRDHGPGIPAASRHRIFQRFDRAQGRRSVGGSGLGLAIVDAIARAHAGSCTVSETPGGGATFTITLPLQRAPLELPSPVRAGDVVQQREETG